MGVPEVRTQADEWAGDLHRPTMERSIAMVRERAEYWDTEAFKHGKRMATAMPLTLAIVSSYSQANGMHAALKVMADRLETMLRDAVSGDTKR